MNLFTRSQSNELWRQLDNGDISDINDALDIIEKMLPERGSDQCITLAKELQKAYIIESGKEYSENYWAADGKTRNFWYCVAGRILFPGNREGEG